jgi:putative hydrolase of the HAD superfamily
MPWGSVAAAILFDIDGTLMDDEGAMAGALSGFHARHGAGLGLSLEELTLRWRELLELHFGRYLSGGVSMQEQRRARIRELFASASTEACDQLFAGYERDYRASWRAYPDALPVLAELSGFPLAVLSNGDQAQQTEKLQGSGLASHFSAIFTSSEIGWAKPDSRAFLAACRRIGVTPGQCIYVGDSLRTDARGSAAAGLRAVWLDRAASGIHAGPGVRVIHTLSELPSIL